jgi:hypothetical protein
VSNITCGEAHVCALLTIAAIKCWGWNAFGQLGVCSTTIVGTFPSQMGNNLGFFNECPTSAPTKLPTHSPTPPTQKPNLRPRFLPTRNLMILEILSSMQEMVYLIHLLPLILFHDSKMKIHFCANYIVHSMSTNHDT